MYFTTFVYWNTTIVMSKRLSDYESYGDNPFVLDKDSEWFKPLPTPTDDAYVTNDGELFVKHNIRFIDRKPYIKMYMEAIPIIGNLSYRGHRVLYYLLEGLGKGQDEVYLHTPTIAEKYDLKNTRDILSGIKELIDMEVLARKAEKDMYFINVRYLFNGDRVKYKNEREK